MTYSIVAQSDQAHSEYFAFLLRGNYDFNIVFVADARECIETIKTKGIPQLLIIGAKTLGFLDILSYYDQIEVRFPMIVTGKLSEQDHIFSKFKPSALSRFLVEDCNAEQLFEIVDKFIKIESRKKEQNIYCKVNIDFFKSASELFCDVFLRLSDEKYIKIIDRYQPIAPDLIERYINKDIRHLFVKINDFKLLTNQLTKRLVMDNSKSLTTYEKSRALIASPPSSVIFPIQLQETVYESISKIGLNDKSVEMASMAISSTLEIIEQDKVSFENLSKFLKKGDYLSSHSFFLAYISCAILRESQWRNPMNLSRLTLASFFHDIGLVILILQKSMTWKSMT